MINYNGYILTDKIGAPCAKQMGLFTTGHVKHYLTITITNPAGVKNIYKTTYQFNPACVKYKSGDGLRAVLMDAAGVIDSDNLTDFIKLYGYDNAANGRRAFNGCRRAYEFLTAAGLTSTDILELVNNEK